MNVNILRFPNIRCLLNSLHLLKSVAECMKAFLYGLYVLLTSLMLFFSSSALLSCAYAAENTGSDKAWTLMVYMCADNDLEEMALYDNKTLSGKKSKGESRLYKTYYRIGKAAGEL